MIGDSITRFMTLKYRNERKEFVVNSINATDDVIATMEEKGLIKDNCDGAELLHRCKRWEDAVC